MARPLSSSMPGTLSRWRWGMIPMTRAIDTLVLQVAEDGPTSELLAELTRGRDYVEVVGH